jgi:hypothetical protein
MRLRLRTGKFGGFAQVAGTWRDVAREIVYNSRRYTADLRIVKPFYLPFAVNKESKPQILHLTLTRIRHGPCTP